MRQIKKIFIAIGIIAFAASITAVSCGKTAGGGGNNNNNTANTNTNSGSGGNGNGGNNSGGGGNTGCTGICPTTNLILANSAGLDWVKINGNTVTINAARLAGESTPHSDANDNNRGYDDAVNAGLGVVALFQIGHPSSITEDKAIMFFVNRASISTNNITMPATSATACSSSETGDNTLATSGNNTCRVYTAGGRYFNFQNYLGTVFNNTDTANRARGSMRCNVEIKSEDKISTTDRVVSDTVAFNKFGLTTCSIAVVNSGGGAAAAEIDDAWVGDAASTTEVELHAIGIDVSGKMLPQFSSEAGYGLTRFTAAHDNAAFKRLLQTNTWGELKFKVKIVAAANF